MAGETNNSEISTLSVSETRSIQQAVECKGIRSTSDFPRDISGLSLAQVQHHYIAMRNSHASLTRSRGQLQRRSREFSEARLNFLNTLKTYEDRLFAIGEEKAEAMQMAKEMHQELEAFESKQQALDQLQVIAVLSPVAVSAPDAAEHAASSGARFNFNNKLLINFKS